MGTGEGGGNQEQGWGVGIKSISGEIQRAYS